MRPLWIITTLTTVLLCAAASGEARESQLLDSGWRFKLGDVAGGESPALDDSGWQSVSLPHNWGWEDAQQGKNIVRGPGWYRRQLEITPQPGKRYFLKFDAASLVADLYFNGELLGQHRGGFGAFCYEITKELSHAETNETHSGKIRGILALRVDNSKFPDIAPLEGDFSIYGGLYRPAHLITTSEQNFSLTDHGSPGVEWAQTSVNSNEATLNVMAEISNGARAKKTSKLIALVMDADGKTVVREEQSVSLASRDTAPYWLRVVVPQPHLWNGRKDPYLYKAVVQLEADGETLDTVEQPLGLRFYSIDPEKGFFLNGQPYHLHGVDRHQDYMNEGWAISEANMEEDVSQLMELGATVVRCAHYQHSDYFYSLCDRAGILVWAEIPQVNVVRDTPEFENTSSNQLLDLIRQNFNHSSIFVWSLFNEIGSKSDDPHRELQDLTAIAHGEDPTRPTIAATMTDARPEMNKIPDQLGWNIYPGWYSGAKEKYGAMLDARQNSSRHGGFCLSEYGAGANTTQHEDHPAQPKPTGQWHPEEWQALLHETAWAALKERPFVWGTFVWCMFDFAVATRHEGGQVGLNDKGLVTRDRKTKKDAFYFYKANWSEQPVLYIISRRFVDRTNAAVDVKIYSNAQDPELFLNGVSQGKKSDGTNCVFIWKNLSLMPGQNKISARAVANGQSITDECVWILASP